MNYHIRTLVSFLLVQVGLLSSWKHLTVIFNSCEKTSRADEMVFHAPDPLSLERSFDDEDQYLDGVVVRAFPSWPEDLPIPCGKADPRLWWHPKEQRSPSKDGYLYVREMKTGSSTIGGVVLRIARNVARRRNQTVMCKNRMDHSPARNLQYADRDKDLSFLFTVIRDPMKRILSQFFHFEVSREKRQPSDANFQALITDKKYMHDYYLKDLALIPADPAYGGLRTLMMQYSPSTMDPSSLLDLRLELANGIMRGYDFIGLTERMDESLVVMMMLLRLKITDMLYIKAKSNGGFDDGAWNGTCSYIIPSFVSPGMKEFFASPFYQNISQGDWMLYRAANKSLDRTIDRLGRKAFEQKLMQFRAANKFANDRCAAGIRYPCSEGGVRARYKNHVSNETDCLWLDSGCGADCLDALEPEIDAMLEGSML